MYKHVDINKVSNPRVAAAIHRYNEDAKEMRSDLEAQYLFCLSNGDEQGMQEALQRMLQFGLITESDNRLPKTKNKNKVIDGVTYIPKYIYADIKSYNIVKVNTMAHWGKRVEGAYEGDVKIREGALEIRVTHEETVMGIKNSIEDAARILKGTPVKFNPNDYKDLAYGNVIQVFRAEFKSNVHLQDKYVAYAFFCMGISGFEIKTIINYKALCNSWVDIDEFVKKFVSAISNLTGCEFTARDVHGYKEAKEIQRNLIRDDKGMDESNAKLVAKLEAEKRKEAAEKAAAEAEKEAKKAAKAAARAAKLAAKLE